jgi:hypothetical protein
MSLNFEGGKTWPYPTRSVELVGAWSVEGFEAAVIELDESQKEVLKALDDGLFEELKRIKKKKVEKAEKVDGEIALTRNLVKEGYWDKKGVVCDFPELPRTIRDLSEDGFGEKVTEYRTFKVKLLDLMEQIEEDGMALTRSTEIVLDMYRRYTNVAIAELLLSSSNSLKNSERFDKFIKGVFSELDEDGNFVVLGKPLLEQVENIEQESEEHYNYPDVWLDEDDIEIIANVLLKKVGVDGWTVVKRTSDKSTLGVYKPKKEVRLGKNMRRRIEDILPVIAHEIEAHVMHGDNEDKNTYTPKIMKNYSAGGRDSVLSEMLGRWVEDETRIRIGLQPKKPETLYFRTMEKKKEGSNFIECFDFYFRNYLDRQGLNFDEVMSDREKYDNEFDNVYDRVMRLFRKNTPLNDRNNYLVTSDQLKYLEQNMVYKKLKDLGLENLMLLDGADLYFAEQIKELGLLQGLEKNKPKFVLADEIWPVIKKGLDNERNIKDILIEMKIE